MNKKLILKYVLLYLPFITGLILYGYGICNLFSSLLLFLGGYVSIKNTFDYRKVKKNIESSRVECIEAPKQDYTYKKNPENMIGFKRARRYMRVRKRIKY